MTATDYSANGTEGERRNLERHQQHIVRDDLKELILLLNAERLRSYEHDSWSTRRRGEYGDKPISHREHLRLARLLVYFAARLGLLPDRRCR